MTKKSKKEAHYLGIRITPETHEKLKKLAEGNEETVSTLVRRAIRTYIEK